MTGIRILADDLTGALDTAAAFAGEVPVFLDVPPAAVEPAQVSAVATATRDVAVGALPSLLAAPIGWLAHGKTAFKKIDSLLRGNTFAEVACVARTGGFPTIVFAPAFPRQGRITHDGRQWVVPPGRTFADRTPVDDGNAADALRVFGLEVSTTSIPPAGGAPAVWLPDVRSDEEFASIVAQALPGDRDRRLWCGSAGLAHAIAAAKGRSPAPHAAGPLALPRGPLLLISASHHPVVRKQWEMLRSAERAAIMVPHSRHAALRSAFRAMGNAFDVAMFDLSPTRLLMPSEAAKLLAGQLDAIVKEAPRPAAVIVVGGDTLRSVCRAAGAQALLAGASVRTGWGLARMVGGRWDGISCFSRSGAFGDVDDLATMVERIVAHTARTRETS
jgi:D-threonate/D-erythronate kinase